MSTLPDLPVEANIADLERRWTAAFQRKDIAAMQRFLADGYALIIAVEGERLQLVPRNAWFDSLEDYEIEEAAIDQILRPGLRRCCGGGHAVAAEGIAAGSGSQRAVYLDRHLGEAGERLAPGGAPLQPSGASRLSPTAREPARMQSMRVARSSFGRNPRC